MRQIISTGLILIIASGCFLQQNGSSSPSPQWVQIDGAMLQLLDRIHGALTEEVAVCLDGVTADGVLHVQRFRATSNISFSATHVRYDPCEAGEFLGVFHTHPGGGVPCMLSSVDRANAERWKHRVDIVSCGGGMFWWQLTGGAGGLISRAPN